MMTIQNSVTVSCLNYFAVFEIKRSWNVLLVILCFELCIFSSYKFVCVLDWN